MSGVKDSTSHGDILPGEANYLESAELQKPAKKPDFRSKLKRVVVAVLVGSLTTIGLGALLSMAFAGLTVWRPNLLNASAYIVTGVSVNLALPLAGGGMVGLSMLNAPHNPKKEPSTDFEPAY